MYFDKERVAKSAALASQWQEVQNRRNAFENVENMIAQAHGLSVNQAARIPTDAYRDIDARTKQLMVGDEGSVILNDLLPLAKTLPIGKIVSEYRRMSDSGNGQSSISGQLSKNMDKATYDFEGTLVLIHDDSFGREWREFEAMRSEGFDALMDDQSNSVRTVRRLLVGHIVNGVAGVKYKGAEALGIKSRALALDLDASGVNVDLTSAALTYADAEKAIIAALTTIQGTNNADGDVTFYVSNQIWFNLLKRTSNDSNFDTFLDALSRIPGVAGFKRTSDATILTGNQFIAGILSDQYIQPVVGMALNTVPVPRQMPYADYNFVTWAAAGIHIKRDSAGRQAWLYARAIP